MPRLIHHLKGFNRKERFILLHGALGFTEQSFSLGKEFSDKLTQCLSRKGNEIPRSAYVAMDYHLDWLQMALWLTEHSYPRSTIRNNNLVRGNQEDIDLLVAFADVTPHFVLASPTESSRIKTANWPNWMTEDGKPLWIELPLENGLRKVTRCHKDGTHAAGGKFLTIKPVRK